MEKIEPIWTVVGNIVEKRINGQDGKSISVQNILHQTQKYILFILIQVDSALKLLEEKEKQNIL